MLYNLRIKSVTQNFRNLHFVSRKKFVKQVYNKKTARINTDFSRFFVI